MPRLHEDQGDLDTATRLKQQARRLKEKAATFLREANVLLEAAEKLEKAAPEEGRSGRDQHDDLSHSDQSGSLGGKVTTPQTAVKALAISRGRSGTELAKAANAVDMTMPDLTNAVAKRLGRPISKSAIFMALSGDRSIKREVTEAIQALTRSEKFPKGFESTRRNWPKLKD